MGCFRCRLSARCPPPKLPPQRYLSVGCLARAPRAHDRPQRYIREVGNARQQAMATQADAKVTDNPVPPTGMEAQGLPCGGEAAPMPATPQQECMTVPHQGSKAWLSQGGATSAPIGPTSMTDTL